MTVEDGFDGTQARDMLFNPLGAWYTNNPTLRPRYIMFSWGVPIYFTNFASSGLTLPEGGSVQNAIRAYVPGRKPALGALNLETTNDVVAYINKLKTFGSTNPPFRIFLSASRWGYDNRTLTLSDYYPTNFTPGANFSGNPSMMPAAVRTLKYSGIALTNLYYGYGRVQGVDGIATNTHYSGDYPIRYIVNPAAISCWGKYAYNLTGLNTNWNSGWPTNGVITLDGSANWYILQSYESFNGNFNPTWNIVNQSK